MSSNEIGQHDSGMAQTSTSTVQPPVDHRPVHRFTSANARQMAAKAHQAKREAAEQRQKRLGNVPHDATEYANIRLLRVRAQLNKLDEMIAEETDPQKLDRLASAQARLSNQEFALAGRPMPGSRRPGREKPKRESFMVEPME